ncbi:MAG: CDP-alcohol phosphatidyltransferase family protein [Verrucomicrobiota bacterium]
MTIPNYITLLRILLIPLFLGALIYYDQSSGLNELYRLIALWSFVIASICDGLDGFLARKLRQESQLGALLDPLADKALILSAIITLSITNVPELYQLPLWFAIIIVSRDILVTIGFAILHHVVRYYKVSPHWSGKTSTVFLMGTIIMILLKITWLPIDPFVYCTGALILYSGVVYILRGIRFVQDSGQA